MKRSLIILCVAALLATLPLAHIAQAGKVEKVAICHVNSANDIIDLETGYAIAFGRIIEVPESAVEAHLAHGDCTNFFPITPEAWELIEEVYGISLPNANVWFVDFID